MCIQICDSYDIKMKWFIDTAMLDRNWITEDDTNQKSGCFQKIWTRITLIIGLYKSVSPLSIAMLELQFEMIYMFAFIKIFNEFILSFNFHANNLSSNY